MSAVAIYNGYGKYEERDGEKGITLKYGGIPFWFPYQKVTYVPDYTMREVDHAASSTGGTGEESILTYKTFRVSGQRLAEELFEKQDPTKNIDTGFVIVQIDKKKLKGTTTMVFAGVDEDGHELTQEVPDITPSQEEKDRAEHIATKYKERVVREYLQSKREHMSGHQGQAFATGLTQTYMDELGVKDLDDISLQTGNTDLKALLALLSKAAQPTPDAVMVPAAPSKNISDLV